MNICEKAANDNTKPITCNSPCCMFSARAAAEIFSSYKYFSSESRIIQDEIFSLPSGLYRQSLKRLSPKPALSVALRKRAGIIWSVSMFSKGSGTHVERTISNFCFISKSHQSSWICYFTCYSCCRCCQRTCKTSSGTRSLAPFEISIAC